MDTSQSKKYAFVLGRERDLCLAELRATLSRFGFCFGDFILSDNVALFNLDKNPAELIDILGGTTKIYEIVETQKDIRSQIKDLIILRSEKTTGKFNFGFSAYGRHRADSLNPLGLNIKKDLKSQLSLRFIALKDKELSTIVSSKNKLADEGLEVGFFNDEIGILIAVTDPEAWSERDYGKPRGDKFSGMVPPKLARIMINLVLGETKNQNSNTLIIDPFCGSGNILLEAIMLGCDVFGSDVSEKAISDSKENVEWLLKVHSTQPAVHRNYKIVQADATTSKFTEYCELSTENHNGFVIVCEPYLGEPKKYLSSIRSIRGEYEKVRELYLDFLRNVSSLSSQDSGLVICLVFPLVETVEKTKFSLYAESVDEIKKIGYTELAKPLVYGRDYQVVKREIALLKL